MVKVLPGIWLWKVLEQKNMFDSSYINNQWVGSSGSIDPVTGANARKYSCKSGDTFTLSATFGSSNSNNIIAMAFYNASGTLFDDNPSGGITIENGLIKGWQLKASSGEIKINEPNNHKTIITVSDGLIVNWEYQ